MKSFANTFGRFRKNIHGAFARPTGHKRRRHQLSIELLESRELLAASFLASAQPSGSVTVQLDPLANVTPGVQKIVTFGLPFTRGSVTLSQLSEIRVLKNGTEIPAFVEQLTPWRSIDDSAIDGQSVRVARIQIPYTFTTLATETITVQWGGPARTLNRTALQDPRLQWHTVTSGSFVAADNVQEPDVLPVLPAAYMSLGMLDSQTIPTNSSVPEARDNPAVIDTTTFTGYSAYDAAEKNFFYTIDNQNGGAPIDYKTQAEPWLYDRSTAMYELYFRSGFATALREAIRSTDFYVDHLDSSGFFTLKPGDPKYSYNESLAYTYWLLGDSSMLTPIVNVVHAFDGTATHWTPDLSFFTERNTGDKLLANEMAYEVTGTAANKASVQTIVADFVYLQNGANGQLPADRIDGGLYHYGVQHDISEVSSPTVLIASSWMSVLVVDPMVRVFGVWEDNPQIPDFIVRMGNFEKAASKTDADGQFGGVTRYPDYLMRTDGTSDNRSDTDVQHAMDVGSVAAWATYFAELRGTPDASLRQLANDLYATYARGLNFWTSSTSFTVTPPRRYNWEYKNSASFSWALTAADAPGQTGMLQFSAPSYTVVENQGVATITVTRTIGSTGSVTVNYATSNGTATAGSDYTATTGTLTFANGEMSKTFTIPIINDTAVENAETVVLTLSNPTGGAALTSPATAILTINSDDTTSQPITQTYQQSVNGYTGTTDADISTQYADSTGGNGSTGVDGDQLGVYQLAGTGGYTIEGLIRFSDLGITTNNVTKATVTSATLTLSVDTFDANPILRGYYLQAPWTTAPGTDLGWINRGTGQHWATPGALGQGTDLIAGKSFVISGITGNGAQTMTINLDPAVVQGWIDNPNADQGILLVNETTGAVVRVNASENASASLRPKLSVTYAVSAATAQPGALQFSNATYSVNENAGTATITITRSGGSTGSVTVNYATSNGTATAGSDYSATSGTLTFAAGETSKTFTIPITDDTLVEGNETVNLTLSSPGGGATLGSKSTAALTIVDNDAAQPGVLQFSAATYSVDENGGTATITVTRSGGSTGSVTVNYATSNGTATAGSDYTAASGTLTFAAGETSKTFTIPITDDTLVEGNETVNLTLSTPTAGATLGSQSTATLTIVDNDAAQPGVLQFSAATYSVNENQGTATITVTRTGGSNVPVSVHFATSNGTATAGSDYTAASGTLNFAAGETSKTFAIPITDNTLVEGNETVILTLSSPGGGATLGSQATATLTIVDNDAAQPGVLQFSTSAFSVNENQGTATITVTRTGGSNVPVSVAYATSNGTATAGSDYTATSGTLSFAAGETSKTFTIPITDDTLVEGNETVKLTLSTPTGGATLGSQSTATLTIVDNDTNGQPVTVTLQQGVNGYTGTNDVSISTQYAQYNAGNGTTTFNSAQLGVYQTTGSGSYQVEDLIRFSNLGIPTGATVTGATLTLNIYTWSANPTIRGYYVLAPWNSSSSSNLGWVHRGTGQDWAAPGALGQGTDVISGKSFVLPGIKATGSQTITVNLDPAVIQSWIDNPSADQGILLVNQTPGAIVQVTAAETSTVASRPRLSVTYNVGNQTPQPGALQFSNAAYSVNENGGTATITVARTGGSAASVSVHFATSNGTAAAGSDYTATSGTLTFAAGETSKTFTIPITDDTLVEGNETINLTLSSPTGGATLGSQSTATLTIVDNEVAQPGVLQFSAANFSVIENQGTATITVTRTGGSNVPVSVHFATSNGTATAGSDYTAASGTLSFAAGETSKTFTVPITNDTLVEGNETINLTLSSPTGGATLGSQATSVLTIQDDDVATQPGTLQFSAGSYSLLENGGMLTVTVTRTGGTKGAVTVHFATSDGTATAGSDYTATSGTLNFADGETSKTFTVTVLDDSAVEGNETVNLTLSNPGGGATLGSPASVTFTIVDNDSAPGVTLPSGFTQTTVATGLSSGTSLTVAPDGRIFVLEQGGAVRVIKNGALLSTPALTVTTDNEVERGLLSLAFDPNFTTNHFIYVSYTVGGPDPAPAHNRISRFTLNGDVAVAGSEVILFELPATTSRVHASTTLKFGADGKLYVTVGNDNVFGNSQDLTNPFGKILRLNSDGTIPTDNPFFSRTTGNNRAIWAIGLRNPYTFDVQPGTGLMYINDVGESAFEEIDQGVAGANYGWPDSEGYTTNPMFQSPVYAYPHGTGPDQGFAIVGAAFYNPTTATFPSQYVGKYFFMDYVNGWIDFVDPTAPNPKTPTNFASNIPVRFDGGPVDLEVGTDGALYYLDRLGGGVFKIQYTASTQAPTITQQPASQTVTQGQPASFTVVASSALTVTYQWQKMDSGTTTFVNITGATSPTFTITSTTAADNGDQFRCVVSNSAGSATSNVATLTVNATPNPGKLQFSSSSFSVGEGQGTATITVSRSGGSDGAVSVNFATSDGSATAGADYTAASGTLNFAAGETSKTFNVSIFDDAFVEGNESVILTLSNPGGGATLGSPSSGTLTIVDNDPGPQQGKFTNVTVSSGIDAIIAQKYQEDPNWWLSGEHLIDLDNDGDLDLFLDAHNGTSVVALNDGHGKFTRVTSGSWPDTEIHEMADINGDGKVDINATFQDGGSQWWINNSTPGHVNFTPTSITRDGNTSRSQVMFDFNGDGKVDWLRSAEPGLVVDFGDGKGNFTEGSLSFPIAGTTSNENANFLPGDFDGDGKIDLLVMTGGGYDGTVGKTALWHNNGNMTFTDITASSGLPLNGTVVKGVGDFNQDGHLDIIAVENKSMPPAIYLNDGHGHFTKKAGAISGVAPESLDYAAWGTAVTTDVDNDGIPDIVMDGKYYLKVLRGTGGGNFTYMNDAWGITDTAASAVDDGLCFGDIDGDGKMDMIGYDETFPTRTLNVYHNDLATQNWLNVRPVGLAGNVGAAGATISVFAAGTNQLLWEEQVAQYDFQVATSYYGTSETERHFGLGSRANVDVVVQFASGKVTRVNNVTANQTIRVLES